MTEYPCGCVYPSITDDAYPACVERCELHQWLMDNYRNPEFKKMCKARGINGAGQKV